jgi:hypothetical protein
MGQRVLPHQSALNSFADWQVVLGALLMKGRFIHDSCHDGNHDS